MFLPQLMADPAGNCTSNIDEMISRAPQHGTPTHSTGNSSVWDTLVHARQHNRPRDSGGACAADPFCSEHS
jgi:hypothetical protein